MQLGRDVALWIGGPRESAGARTNPAQLLAGVVREIRKYPTPADALDGFCSRGDALRSTRLILLVVDQRGRPPSDIRWTWLTLLAHLGFGPLILLVDELEAAIVERARRSGVLRCIEERHLARHPGLLRRAVRRALGSPAPVAVRESVR